MKKERIESIDILRGIVMVIMALDHVRDYFHITSNTENPLDLATTTPALFVTRWITHYCAPVFVFLSGTSAYLQKSRKSTAALGGFLMKRGLWLIVVECTLVAFAWTFNPYFNLIPFQVIWAIGISMFLLGLLIRLNVSDTVLLIGGLLLVGGHNLLDIPEAAAGFQPNFWWDLLHHGHFMPYRYAPDHVIMLVYPFPPWTGLMMLGYCAGRWFLPSVTTEKRKKLLLRTGLLLMVTFVALRMLNVYGDPKPWTVQKNGLFTVLSFLNTAKYPPSLLYLCMTIGPALIVLAFLERMKNRFNTIMITFGRTAFFYYIVHIYLIHLLATALFFYRGHILAQASLEGHFPFWFVVPGEGVGLVPVYLIWMGVIAQLYPICRSYDRYKSAHREKWWLSYL